jgi:hypothetical protein
MAGASQYDEMIRMVATDRDQRQLATVPGYPILSMLIPC